MADRFDRPIDPAIVSSVAQQKPTYRYNWNDGGWYGPLRPLPPMAPPDVAGRMFDYPFGQNLKLQPRADEPITFAQLRALADNYDLLRVIIEKRKDEIAGYEWTLRPTEKKPASDSEIERMEDFFQIPDKEFPFDTWLKMMLEDLLVLDAVCIYPRITRGGAPYSLELMAPDYITRKISYDGRTPTPPDPAYQQIIKGLPSVDYTTDELIYLMRNPRTNRLYGFGPVEWIVMTVNIALRKQLMQLQWFTEGTVPDAIMGLPDTWSIDQVKQFQAYWDLLLTDDTAQRRKVRFVPFDPGKTKFTKEGSGDDQKGLFDEWLARLICFAFDISPHSLVRDQNRSTAQTSKESAKETGLTPMLNWIKKQLDFVLHRHMKVTGMEWNWEQPQDIDPEIENNINAIKVKAGRMTINEWRDRDGEGGLGPNGDIPLIYTAQGAVTLESVINPPEPIAPALGPDGLPVPGKPAAGGGAASPAGVKPKAKPESQESAPPDEHVKEEKLAHAAELVKRDDFESRLLETIRKMAEKPHAPITVNAPIELNPDFQIHPATVELKPEFHNHVDIGDSIVHAHLPPKGDVTFTSKRQEDGTLTTTRSEA